MNILRIYSNSESFYYYSIILLLFDNKEIKKRIKINEFFHFLEINTLNILRPEPFCFRQ